MAAGYTREVLNRGETQGTEWYTRVNKNPSA